MVSHNGELWVLAPGGTAAVYSTVDGTTWTEHTADAAFGQRKMVAGASFGGDLWLIGGDQPGATDARDSWVSVDGATWRRGHRTVVNF